MPRSRRSKLFHQSHHGHIFPIGGLQCKLFHKSKFQRYLGLEMVLSMGLHLSRQ